MQQQISTSISLEPISLLLYDTLSRSIKPIQSSDQKTIRIYTCGPTIYDRAHIGNFRTFIFEDILRRTLLLFGHKVTQVMNLTDVDDKTIKGAITTGLSLQEYTEKFAIAFFQDLTTLRIQPVEHYPRATAYIDAMIELIQILISKNAAYVANDKSVYFRISACQEYGKLSHLHLMDLQQGASDRRVLSDEYDKQGTSDFVLWKAFDATRDGTIYWNSPWGRGRPGWHIECSVMAKKILGETIDLHAGGVDLIFPHHENEIAQSETCSNSCFSHHWAHAEHLLVDNKKMSKSLKNFYTLHDLLDKGYNPVAVRFLLLSSHYRTQLNFTLDGILSAESSIKRIRDCFLRIQHWKPSSDGKLAALDPSCNMNQLPFDTFTTLFFDSLARDLNISEALATLFDAIRKINTALDNHSFYAHDKQNALQFFSHVDAILDILTFDPIETVIPAQIEELMQQRQTARAEKNWKESDRLRDVIQQKGYFVEDTKEGQKVSKGGACVSQFNN